MSCRWKPRRCHCRLPAPRRQADAVRHADSQHIAAELTGRLVHNRRPLSAPALTTDTSALTCIGDDYAFDQVFVRQVLALGRPGDCLLALSTSGRSADVVQAVEAAALGLR